MDNKIKSESDSKIVLVVGAGIHAAVGLSSAIHRSSLSQLSSWDAIQNGMFLAERLGPTLSWELNSLEGIQNGQAKDRVSASQEKLVSKINDLVSTKLIDAWVPPTAIEKLLLSGRVEHVISLNIDLLLENWLSKKLVLNALPRVKVGSDKISEINKTRRREFNLGSLSEQKKLLFWYPHGDCCSSASLQFSLSHYATSLKWFDDARKRFKAEEHKNEMQSPKIESWLDLFLSKQRILFVGTSLDRAEWDIWSALLLRWRNFLQYGDKHWCPETFVLTCKGEHKHLPPKYFSRIELESYAASWQLLEELIDENMI